MPAVMVVAPPRIFFSLAAVRAGSNRARMPLQSLLRLQNELRQIVLRIDRLNNFAQHDLGGAFDQFLGRADRLGRIIILDGVRDPVEVLTDGFRVLQVCQGTFSEYGNRPTDDSAVRLHAIAVQRQQFEGSTGPILVMSAEAAPFSDLVVLGTGGEPFVLPHCIDLAQDRAGCQFSEGLSCSLTDEFAASLRHASNLCGLVDGPDPPGPSRTQPIDVALVTAGRGGGPARPQRSISLGPALPRSSSAANNGHAAYSRARSAARPAPLSCPTVGAASMGVSSEEGSRGRGCSPGSTPTGACAHVQQ